MIKVGDKITVAVSWDDPSTGACADGSLVHTTVKHVDDTSLGFFCDNDDLFLPDGTTVKVNIVGGCAFAEETLTWIRGWAPLDSPEAKALIAAHLLGPGAVPSQLFVDHSSPFYTKPWWYDFDHYGTHGWVTEDDFEARGLVR